LLQQVFADSDSELDLDDDVGIGGDPGDADSDWEYDLDDGNSDVELDLTGVPNVDKGHPASPVGLGQDNVHSDYSDSDGGDANKKHLRRQSPSPECRDSSGIYCCAE
jgi:hypothetical protein